jgi:hypothetical protein
MRCTPPPCTSSLCTSLPCMATSPGARLLHAPPTCRSRRCLRCAPRTPSLDPARHRSAQLLLLHAIAGLVGPGLAMPFQRPHTCSSTARAAPQPASLARPRSCAPARAAPAPAQLRFSAAHLEPRPHLPLGARLRLR